MSGYTSPPEQPSWSAPTSRRSSPAQHTSPGPSLTIELLAWGVGASVGAFGSGWLTDRYGADVTLGFAIAGVAIVLLAIGYAVSAGVVFPLMVIGGAASWSINTPLNHRLTGLAPALPAVIISFNSSGTYLGQALGAMVGGLLLWPLTAAQRPCASSGQWRRP